MQAWKPISLFIMLAFLVGALNIEDLNALEGPLCLPDLKFLSTEEVCDAICYAPTGTAQYYFYEADMLVLRQVFRGLKLQKTFLQQKIQHKSPAEGKAHIHNMKATFNELIHAYKGVDSDFLVKFDTIAIFNGLESPVGLKNKIVAVAKEVCKLGNEWLSRYLANQSSLSCSTH